MGQLRGGSLTLEGSELVFSWTGALTAKVRREASPHHIRLEDVAVVEVRAPTKWAHGWVRFGSAPLDGRPLTPPDDRLDWIHFTPVDPGLGELSGIVAHLCERLGVPDPLVDVLEKGRESASSSLLRENRRETRSFHIHALGPSGSGKTVFLASLYSRMRIRRPDLAFYLSADHETSLALNAVFNQVASPTESWPEASQSVNEWRFRTRVPSRAGDFEPLEFVYLDYPGGALTNPRAMQDRAIQELVDRLRSANALLVLLDGLAMLQLLRGDREGQRYLDFDITSSLEIAQQSRCPIHFAVTKWDLLEGRFTLNDLRAALMANRNFADLIHAKTQDIPGTIRLLPVSAVGTGFAELQPGGEMRKLGRSPEPYQVDLPLVSVFPDFFQFAYEELRAQGSALDEIRQTQSVQRFLDPDTTNKFKQALRGAAKKAMPLVQTGLRRRSPALAALLSMGGDWMIDDVFDYADRLLDSRSARAEQGRSEYARALMETRQRIDSDRAALQLVERQCEGIISDFEIEHPESVLAGGLQTFEPDEVWAVSMRTPPGREAT